MNALFIGYGSMGSAIGAAWLEAKLVDSISAVVLNPRASTSATLYPSLQALPQQPFDLIVVATKPAQACAVLADLPDALCAGSLVISVGGMALLLFMLRTGTAGKVAANFYLTPGVTALLGWLVLGEGLSATAILGFALASKGVWLVNRRGGA